MIKKIFHVITSIHDSRTSERMIRFRARERRFNGTKPFPEVYYLSVDEELLIARTVGELVTELNWEITAFNCWKDQLQLLIVCTEEELPKIMHRLKGRTARVCNAYRAANGINPFGCAHAENSKESTRVFYNPTVLKDKSTPFWAQKFHRKTVTSTNQYWNAYNYIQTIRLLHGINEPIHLHACIQQFIKPLQVSSFCFMRDSEQFDSSRKNMKHEVETSK